MARKRISVYISCLLRHKPDDIGPHMDSQGWVSAEHLTES